MKKIKEKTTPEEIVLTNESKAIVPQENQLVNYSTEALIARAIDQKVDVGTMERLLVMAKEMQAIKAKQEFDKAMAKFQSECPIIKKNETAGKESFKYKYASLDYIVSQVRELLSKNGFSYTFDSQKTEKSFKTFCKVKHITGYMEISEFEITIDTNAKMNISQKDGAASSYGKRYAFCNAFGILTGDDDVDGADLSGEIQTKTSFLPSEKQLETIKKNMEQKNVTEAELIDNGFPPIKDLTGGKEGTASEVIGYLFSLSNYSNSLKGVTDEDRMVTSFIKRLEECTVASSYQLVADEIKWTKEQGQLSESGYAVLLKVCKQIVAKLTKPQTLQEKANQRAREIRQAKTDPASVVENYNINLEDPNGDEASYAVNGN